MVWEPVFGVKFSMQPPGLDCLKLFVISFTRLEGKLILHPGEKYDLVLECIISFEQIKLLICILSTNQGLELEHCREVSQHMFHVLVK